MINRILIRIKVIQTLYSFLLVEKQFTLERNPSAPTKEKRFSFALYQDLLLLLIKVAEYIERRPGDRPLLKTRFISRLLIDDTIKQLIEQSKSAPSQLLDALPAVAEAVRESGLYKNYLKDLSKNHNAPEDTLWRDLFNLVIINVPALLSLISQRENYTLKGLERMKEMMNRTFVNFLTSQDNVLDALSALENSLNMSRQLYMRLLYLPVELSDLEERLLDEARHKHLPTEQDINPNLRFVENQAVDILRNDPILLKYIRDNKISWYEEDPIMMHKLLDAIKSSDIYGYYMSLPSTSATDDAAFLRDLYRHIIFTNPDFLECLESMSVFWNDDIDILSTFVLKSIRRIENGDCLNVVLDKYKDEEDARFGAELIRALYNNKEQYRLLIDDAVSGSNWDKDRLAFMDIVILETAIAEIFNFPKIPIQVSVNEYIEMAKSYSTPRSGQFVHGILGSIISRLQKENKLRTV